MDNLSIFIGFQQLHKTTGEQCFYKCRLCGNIVDGMPELFYHIKEQHGIEEFNSKKQYENTKPSCKIVIPKKMVTSDTKYIRINYNLIPIAAPNDNTTESTQTVPNVLEEKAKKTEHNSNFKYWCEICDERFCFPNLFQDHINLHTRHKPYVCDHCTKRFCTMLHLSQHLNEGHTTSEYRLRKCEICGNLTTSLQKHMKTVHNIRKKSLCYICGLEVYNLGAHVKKCHDKLFNYQCEECGKRFNSANYLAVHKNTHNVNKQHCCDICGKTFTFRSGLKAHKKLHVILSCVKCKKNFITKLDYRKHLKTNCCIET